MGDPVEMKSKGPYNHWSEPENKMLLRLLVDGINQGFRDANGKFNKLIVEIRILSTLNQKLGTKKTYNQYKNRMKILKGKYQSLADLLRYSSGFGWDDYLKAHPTNKHLRDESFEDFEDLRIIFGSNVATGQNVMGLGDAINAFTYQTEDNEKTNDFNRLQMMNDVDGVADEGTFDYEIFSSLEKNMGGKLLPQRKKARTDASSSNKNFAEVNTMSEIGNQIFGMIQKKWEKELEEKEAEEKATNVWDAIKEIPDLDENLHYEAMTLVHSLGMKSGFMHMSIAERDGWIKRNLCKPKE